MHSESDTFEALVHASAIDRRALCTREPGGSKSAPELH